MEAWGGFIDYLFEMKGALLLLVLLPALLALDTKPSYNDIEVPNKDEMKSKANQMAKNLNVNTECTK